MPKAVSRTHGILLPSPPRFPRCPPFPAPTLPNAAGPAAGTIPVLAGERRGRRGHLRIYRQCGISTCGCSSFCDDLHDHQLCVTRRWSAGRYSPRHCKRGGIALNHRHTDRSSSSSVFSRVSKPSIISLPQIAVASHRIHIRIRIYPRRLHERPITNP